VRIAVVSDTHLPRFGRQLPRALEEGIRRAGVDLILHAGDWTEPFAVALFEDLANVGGVAGNNDSAELHERFGTRAVVGVGGLRVGITHGHLGPGRTTRERAIGTFRDERVDVIAYGHSHIPHAERLPGGTWLVNPGSPTDRRTQPYYSWLLLQIDDGRLERPRHVAYERHD
jgi:putative phosphoesterase